MAKKRRNYEPRVFDGRLIMPDEIERIHKEVLEFERIEAISEPMRELIEDLWRTGAQAAAEEAAGIISMSALGANVLQNLIALGDRARR